MTKSKHNEQWWQDNKAVTALTVALEKTQVKSNINLL